MVARGVHRCRLGKQQKPPKIDELCHSLFEWSLRSCILQDSEGDQSFISGIRAACNGFRLLRWYLHQKMLRFLLSCQVQHFQWTDNSAARQLVARQGVGRIRHLSGKILWIQDAVLAGEVQVGQVPTMVNFSVTLERKV